ncbi:sulfur carrier protein ThiS adenylyltransferase ThiF [Leuconostoc gelidum]|uniref:sulfur carrier protein ThiS adenylyltransferase ThiF n=1 Tax=Leuconostoc gelidum TaxID=1244 RepID=UPI001C7DB90C|nr:sulfur carrier protein ThiS adenylyltransferase ThiF [Leuconostoc gelidum]MBZ6010120.1 sulfur carrier protein ThiS adenylyltransferase ThiF [Leuconostoc gelidum subsp. aenigmaticum]
MAEISIDGTAISEIYKQMSTRNVAETQDKLAQAHVTIAGAGGLGSNIAIALARSGIGHLTLIDFDVVDYSNLNRQQFKLSQIGVSKVTALKQNILEFNPFVDITAVQTRVTFENFEELFKTSDVICEAFDDPTSKAVILQSAREIFSEKPIVLGNGLAGIHSANDIVTRKMRENVYICGDQTTAGVEGLMAPRVIICAGHQANMILQLLVNKIEI